MTDIPEVDLGNGVAMPMVGFGTWNMHGKKGYEAIRYALRTGYRHIDTATMYKNEAEVGRAIADSGLDRRDVFVTTKLLPSHAARARAAIADSLRTLGTDYVDLWLVHWPPSRQALLPLWREFLQIRDEGLCRAVGVSNYGIGQVDELIAATGERPAVNQINWSPDLYDPAVLAAHAERGVALEGYSSLKGTQLSNRVLAEIATRHAVTPAQVILRWQLELGITVIPKSVRPERIDANFDLFGFSLTEEEVARVNSL
jgi:diketogulonate reductase-like aldo/keto reductase